MRGTTGAYFPRLDHVRALAAFLVFYWHSVHLNIPTSTVPAFFPASLFEEGWVGVPLFMTLSGYLFAKLLDNMNIDYAAFLWSRFVRLGPLLFVLIAYYVVFHGYDFKSFMRGFVKWDWPGGAWSLTVEMHFYLLFPALLLVQRNFGTPLLASILVISIGLRALLWYLHGEVQKVAYLTIIGNFDEFLLGMVFFYISRAALFKRLSPVIFVTVLVALLAFWHVFNIWGGFYDLGGRYPSPSPLWIILPTIEGAAWGCLIAAYENMTFSMPRFIDRSLARIGEVSYSIYLWHYLLLTEYVAPYIKYPFSLTQASVLSLMLFVPMVFIAILSFEYIERPFMRYRVKYSKRLVPDAERQVVVNS